MQKIAIAEFARAVRPSPYVSPVYVLRFGPPRAGALQHKTFCMQYNFAAVVRFFTVPEVELIHIVYMLIVFTGANEAAYQNTGVSFAFNPV